MPWKNAWESTASRPSLIYPLGAGNVMAVGFTLLSLYLVFFFSSAAGRGTDRFELDACLHRQQVPVEEVELTEKKREVPRPWRRHDADVKAFTSDALNFDWNWLKNLKTRGIHEQTVGDVLYMLDSLDCGFLAWGDVVWRSVRRLKPTTVDGEVECPLDKLYEECVRRFGKEGCSVETDADSIEFVQIGHREKEHYDLLAGPLRFFSAGSRWNVPLTRLGFSIDSLAIYDDLAGKVVLIDLTGHGLSDVCERNLVPAANPEKWTTWVGQGDDRLLRYLELRGQEFRPASADLASLLVKQGWNATGRLAPHVVQKWYCERLLFGHLAVTLPQGDSHSSPSPANSICTLIDDPESHRRINATWIAAMEDIPTIFRDQLDPAIAHLEHRFGDEKEVAFLRFTTPPPRSSSTSTSTSTSTSASFRPRPSSPSPYISRTSRKWRTRVTDATYFQPSTTSFPAIASPLDVPDDRPETTLSIFKSAAEASTAEDNDSYQDSYEAVDMSGDSHGHLLSSSIFLFTLPFFSLFFSVDILN